MKKCIILFLGIVILASFDCKSQNNKKISDSSPTKKLMIGIWNPPPPQLLKTEADIKNQFKHIADAGINLIWGSPQWTYSDSTMQIVLKVCDEYGLSYLQLLEIDGKNKSDSNAELTRCLATVNKLKNFSAVRGFVLYDEPAASLFDSLARVSREVEAILPEGKYTIVNLLPNYGFSSQAISETYVEDFMQKMHPKIFSFDHYPLGSKNTAANNLASDRQFVLDLITMRNASIKYNVPFWGFIQAIAWEGMREPTYNEYRWLCDAHIVFGAKGISYFFYAAGHAMITWDGKTTYLYDYAKNVNRELFGFANIVMSYKQDGFILVNQNTQINTAVPANLTRKTYGNLVSIETSGEMMNGCFDLNGQKAVYLFNWSKDNPMSAKLTFNKNVHFQLWSKSGLEIEKTTSALTVSFLPGEAKFIVFKLK